MKPQSVNIFGEKNIFQVIANSELREFFVRNSDNRNLFTFQECFIEKQDIFDLQIKNDINLAIKINNKKTIGRATELEETTLTKEAFITFEASFYLFTYQPMKQITTQINGINTRADYFYYIDYFLRTFLKPRGLTTTNKTNTYFNKINALENVYNVNASASDFLVYDNIETLNIKLNKLFSVEDK